MAQPRRFSPEDKLDLAIRSYAAPNIREFSRECGVDRTTLYVWRQELAQAALKEKGPSRSKSVRQLAKRQEQL